MMAAEYQDEGVGVLAKDVGGVVGMGGILGLVIGWLFVNDGFGTLLGLMIGGGIGVSIGAMTPPKDVKTNVITFLGLMIGGFLGYSLGVYIIANEGIMVLGTMIGAFVGGFGSGYLSRGGGNIELEESSLQDPSHGGRNEYRFNTVVHLAKQDLKEMEGYWGQPWLVYGDLIVDERGLDFRWAGRGEAKKTDWAEKANDFDLPFSDVILVDKKEIEVAREKKYYVEVTDRENVVHRLVGGQLEGDVAVELVNAKTEEIFRAINEFWETYSEYQYKTRSIRESMPDETRTFSETHRTQEKKSIRCVECGAFNDASNQRCCNCRASIDDTRIYVDQGTNEY